MDRIILHIGTEKTGTTSIQHALAHDRDALAARGILFPRLFGSENHMEIAVYAADDEQQMELRLFELAKAECDLPEYRERLRQTLADEITASGCHTMIISNEHCHSRLLTQSAIERLKDLLTPFCPNIEVQVYLRRQDQLAVSLHSTRLKLGGAGEIFPATTPVPAYFAFDRMLQLYGQFFGQENISARLFEPARLAGGDIVTDFYFRAGIDLPKPDLPKANESLSAKQGQFLEEFNRRFPLVVNNKINPQRGPIFSVISKVGQSAPYRPARPEAEAFYAAFAEGNAWVRETFFADLDRATLFDESFASYPETAEDAALTPDEIFEFVDAIWKHTRYLEQKQAS